MNRLRNRSTWFMLQLMMKEYYDAVMNFGGKAVMTSATHQSGTDRCAEAVDKIMAETGKKIDIVINIQGDEPFIRPEQIDSYEIVSMM